MYVVIYFFPCCLWIFAGLVKALGSAEKREERSGFQKPSDAITSMYPVLRTLKRRQLEVLHLKGIPLPDSEFRVVDLSQNLSFASVTAGKVPCVTPAGEKFLTKECRFITGIESLRLQGIWYDEEKLGRYSSPFLQDLAGNAFENFILLCELSLQCHLFGSQQHVREGADNFLCSRHSKSRVGGRA